MNGSGSKRLFCCSDFANLKNLRNDIHPFDFLSLKSSIGVAVSYGGAGITYDIGPIVSLGSKRLRFVSGALLYGYVGDDSPVYFAIPLGIEFYGKKGLYISPQSIFLLGKSDTFTEFQLGMGVSF